MLKSRTLADLPWGRFAVRLHLVVRKFFCREQGCPRKIFTERLPGVVAPCARRTLRITEMLTLQAFGLGLKPRPWGHRPFLSHPPLPCSVDRTHNQVIQTSPKPRVRILAVELAQTPTCSAVAC